MRRWSLRAKMAFPVDGAPLPGAVIAIEGDRVAALGQSDRADIDLGDVVVVPGLVNAHAHLDLSDCEIPLPMDGTFADWIARVIAHRRRGGADPDAAIRRGIGEILSTATTLVGDVNSGSDSRIELEMAPIDAVVHREVLGIDRVRGDASWADFLVWRSKAETFARVISGISPHAPYSTRLDLMKRASATGLPCQVHLGETAEEAQFISGRAGPLRDLLAMLGASETRALPNSLAEVLNCLPKASLVHGNMLSMDDAGTRGRNVVHCPATHGLFGRSPFPANQWLMAGANVGLGTDGRASSPSLNLGSHLGLLMAGPATLDPSVILRCATLGGARALGLDHAHGSITPGKLANLAVVSYPKGKDLAAGVVEELARPIAVIWRGKWRDAPGLSKLW